MRYLLAVVLTLFVASIGQAQESAFMEAETPRSVEVKEVPVTSTIAATSSVQERTLEVRTVQAEQRELADESAAALPTRRGSFWWFVAVLVVAGVILAVVL